LPVSLKKSQNGLKFHPKNHRKSAPKALRRRPRAFAISERHKNALLIAMDEVKLSINRLKSGSESDFLPAATHARAALDPIGFIFGKNCTDDMLSTPFFQGFVSENEFEFNFSYARRRRACVRIGTARSSRRNDPTLIHYM
jgi:tRNA U34 5-carboxymethylaminomethyl modifying GTPase MnmE/TrmE